MQVLYIAYQGHFRKLVNGVGECCPDCRRPYRYNISGSTYERRQHRCRSKRGVAQPVSEDDEIVDEEQLEGSRIDRGFAMMASSDELDYGYQGEWDG